MTHINQLLNILKPLFGPNAAYEAEYIRDEVEAVHMDGMLDIYRALPNDLALRENFFQAVQDRLMDPGVKDDPRLTVLLVDALSARNVEHSSCAHLNMTVALIVLEEDWNAFDKYYHDLELAKTTAAEAVVEQRSKLAEANLPPVADDLRMLVESLVQSR